MLTLFYFLQLHIAALGTYVLVIQVFEKSGLKRAMNA